MESSFDSPTEVSRSSGARWVRRTLARAASPTLVIADQAVISLLNFGTAALVGAVVGPHELGSFALVWIALTLLVAGSESLVVAPYTAMLASTPPDSLKAYAGGVFLHQVVVCALAALLFAIGAAGLTLAERHDGATLLAAAGLAAPAILLREFARRTSLARLEAGDGVRVDLTTAAVQALALISFALGGALSAATACLAVALGNGAAALLWWPGARRRFQVSWTSARAAFRRHRDFATPSFVALLTFLLQLYAAPVALGVVADRTAVGLFAACHTLVMVSNPLVQGLANYLMPTMAQTSAARPGDGLGAAIWKASRLICLAMVVLSIPFFLAGERLLVLVFGATFAAGGTVAILACAAIIRATVMPSSIALWVFGRSRDNAIANIIGLAVFVVVFSGAFPAWGVVGAASAVLVSDLTAGAVRLGRLSNLLKGRTACA
jgi:O-antigen/teichoic acid export membrane protein